MTKKYAFIVKCANKQMLIYASLCKFFDDRITFNFNYKYYIIYRYGSSPIDVKPSFINRSKKGKEVYFLYRKSHPQTFISNLTFAFLPSKTTPTYFSFEVTDKLQGKRKYERISKIFRFVDFDVSDIIKRLNAKVKELKNEFSNGDFTNIKELYQLQKLINKNKPKLKQIENDNKGNFYDYYYGEYTALSSSIPSSSTTARTTTTRTTTTRTTTSRTSTTTTSTSTTTTKKTDIISTKSTRASTYPISNTTEIIKPFKGLYPFSDFNINLGHTWDYGTRETESHPTETELLGFNIGIRYTNKCIDLGGWHIGINTGLSLNGAILKDIDLDHFNTQHNCKANLILDLNLTFFDPYCYGILIEIGGKVKYNESKEYNSLRYELNASYNFPLSKNFLLKDDLLYLGLAFNQYISDKYEKYYLGFRLKYMLDFTKLLSF